MKAVFLDLETTGLDFDKHVVLDVGVVIVDLNDMSDAYAYTACITCDAKDWDMADPKALKVNGFTKENHWQLSKKDYEVTDDLIDFFKKHEIVKGKAFFICQNPSFDRPFFMQLMSQELMQELDLPYHWLDLASMYWMKYYACFHPVPGPQCMYVDMAFEISLSKDSIAKHIGLPPEEKPHKALNGAIHLMKCYKWMTGRAGVSTRELLV